MDKLDLTKLYKTYYTAKTAPEIVETEGKCVQMLHVGAFNDEPVSLQKMLHFMQTKGMSKNGLHHEIYLSDFRKTAPEDLKTILREPFEIT